MSLLQEFIIDLLKYMKKIHLAEECQCRLKIGSLGEKAEQADTALPEAKGWPE